MTFSFVVSAVVAFVVSLVVVVAAAVVVVVVPPSDVDSLAEDEAEADEPLNKEIKDVKKPKKKKVTKKSPTAKAQGERKMKEKKVEPKKLDNETYRVVYDKEQRNWIVKIDGGQRASKRCATKAEALEVAKSLAKKKDADLSVHKKNGKFQKQK